MSPEFARSVVTRCVAPKCFFVAAPRTMRVEHVPREEVIWEIYLGHLLDQSQTRARQTFESWHVWLDDVSGDVNQDGSYRRGPVISIRLDGDQGELHVCRGLLVRGHETFEPSPGVIDSRPCLKWHTELVGTIDLCRFTDSEGLAHELEAYLDLVVCGVSRLPITSIETPLPDFSLGNLAYVGAGQVHASASVEAVNAPSDQEPRRSWTELIVAALAQSTASARQAHLLEAALRTSTDVPIKDIADRLLDAARSHGLSTDAFVALFRTLFHNLALSPYTSFVDRLTALLKELALPSRLGPEPVADLLSYMLRQLVRHLTAFDLATFHNQGANYPDALALETLLGAYFECIRRHPELFRESNARDNSRAARAHRIRRRALRQACLVRRQYEGHRVPDEPTSPGENLRVLPKDLPHVPDEQLSQVARRRRQLYSDRPLESLLDDATAAILRRSIEDLSHDAELRELGTALFLDRPLGILLPPGHVDRTSLLSYEAFSRRIAQVRLGQLMAWKPTSHAAALDDLHNRLAQLHVAGIPIVGLADARRPGVVSLEDARLASDDFLILRTTRRSLARLWERYDLTPLAKLAPHVADWLAVGNGVLLIRRPNSARESESAQRQSLIAFDRNMQPRVELGLEPSDARSPRHIEIGGEYCLADGLSVLAVWELDISGGAPLRRDLRSAHVRVLPRASHSR